MKKALAILSALALIVPAIFAEGMPAPTLTYGFSGDLETQLVQENTISQTSSTLAENEAAETPNGFKATKLVANTWANMDWKLASIKAEGKYDAFRSTADDYSWMYVTATWKDLFGFKVEDVLKVDNKELGATTPAATKTLNKNPTNEIVITLDRLESEGYKFYAKYNNTVLSALSLTAGSNIDSVVDSFKEIGFEISNDAFGGKVVYNSAVPGNSASLDVAQFEAKKLFGVWNALVNSKDDMGLRIANLDSDVKFGNGDYAAEFKIDGGDGLQGGHDMNMLNTMTFGENVTVKAAMRVPQATYTFRDWIAGDKQGVGNNPGANLDAQVAMKIGTIGEVAVGAQVRNDYETIASGFKGPSKLLAEFNAPAPGSDKANQTPEKDDLVDGNAFWVDANLSGLVGEKNGLFVFSDFIQKGYILANKEATDTDSATEANKLDVGTALRIRAGAEFKMVASDALTLLASAQFMTLAGYDIKGVTGVSFSEMSNDTNLPTATNYKDNYNEGGAIANIFGIKPLIVKVRADYKVSDTLSVYGKNVFNMNDGALKDSSTILNTKDVYGSYGVDTVTLGCTIVSGEKSKLGISTDVNLYLGVPAASDLYLTGLTDAQKKNVDAAYGAFVSSNYNPFVVKASYTYSY